MLDDIDYIARFDSQNALAVAAGLPEQLKYDQFTFTPPAIDQLDNVVIAGMGGSALAGSLLRSWLDDQLKLPVVITRDYSLPGFVGRNTLVIASTYSGDTEETLAAAEVALAAGASVVTISAGGKLAVWAKNKSLVHLSLPTDYQPRLAAWAELRVLAAVFDGYKITSSAVKGLTATVPFLLSKSDDYLPQVATADNPAKQLATHLMGKTVVVYAGPTLGAAAYKWKISFNENAKNLAFANELPELNHNEMIGWTSHPVDKPYAVVELQSSYDGDRLQKRWATMNRLLSGQMPAPIEVAAEGRSKIEQILSTVLLGEFVSIYLGVLNGVNPMPVDLVEKFKTEIG